MYNGVIVLYVGIIMSKARVNNPSQEFLHERFNYNPETGVLSKKDGSAVGHINNHGYMCIRLREFGYASFMVHRLAFIYMTGSVPNCVDHINCDKLDNRWVNLRNASYPLNNRNTPLRRDNKSGIKGVDYHSGKKVWRARIQADGRRYNLGDFKSIEDAEMAIIEARKTLHWSFGRHATSSGEVSFANGDCRQVVKKNATAFMVVRDGVLVTSSWKIPAGTIPNGSVVRVSIEWDEPKND